MSLTPFGSSTAQLPTIEIVNKLNNANNKSYLGNQTVEFVKIANKARNQTSEEQHKQVQTETTDIEAQKQCEAFLNEFEEHFFKNNNGGKIFICPRPNVEYSMCRISKETVRIGVTHNGKTLRTEITFHEKL